MKRIAKEMLWRTVQKLGDQRITSWLMGFLRFYTGRLAPERALRLLFQLDDAMYKLQSETALRYGNGLHPKHEFIGYHDFFLSNLNKGDTVLDVGCGNGALAHSLAAKGGAIVTGIDLNADSIETARKERAHPNLTFMVGDATQPQKTGRFDVVVMSNVLEHIKNRPETLRAIVDAAQPQKVLMRVPLFEREWRVPLKKHLDVEWRLDTTHETEHTQEEFLLEMKQAGLTPVHVETRWGEIWAVLKP
jgi:SAM-dependent methyltransferase